MSHPPEAVTGIVFSIGALLLSPFLFYNLESLKTIQRTGVALIGISGHCPSLCFVFVWFGQKYPLPKQLLYPLPSQLLPAVLGLFLLKEKLSLLSQVGMILFFAGLVILSLGRLRKKGKKTDIKSYEIVGNDEN